jgi:hypothetical protein
MLLTRKIALALVGLPIIKQLATGPIFFYLQRKLAVDMIQVVSQGKSADFAVEKLTEKISEKRMLLNYKILNLCRQIVRDGFMKKTDLRTMEDALGEENSIQERLIKILSRVMSPQVWGELHKRALFFDIHGVVQELDLFVRPSLIPWELDPNFFVKHPVYEKDFTRITSTAGNLQWYLSLIQRVLLI